MQGEEVLSETPRTNIQVIPFRARHVPLIKPGVTEFEMARAERDEKIAHARTVCLLGDPIGAGGITPFEDGSAEAWAIFSPLSKHYAKAMFQACKQGIVEAEAELNPHVLFARADLEDEAAQRFLEHLGYKAACYLFMKERR